MLFGVFQQQSEPASTVGSRYSAIIRMQCVLAVLLLFVLLSVAPHQINITKDYELEEFLCSGTQLLNDTTVKLSTNIHHFIRNASFCIINTTYSLSITSNSSQQAVIQCNDSIMQPSIVDLLLLIYKTWHYKGRVPEMVKCNKADQFYPYHSAVTLFLHIKKLIMKEVNVTHYYGFAMFAINPINATIDHCEVSLSYGGNSPNYRKGYGSSIFLLFANITVLPSSTFNVSIHHSTFNHNSEYYHQQSEITCLTDLKHIKKTFPMFNAAGLTFFLSKII